jgi:Ser/Thr protein kinase RdoA (MazF antagonist)
MQQIEAHADQLATHLVGLDSLPKLVIHGDYYAENIIVRDDIIAGVVDYDQARWCPRVQEVAEAVIFFARERTARFRHIVYSGVLNLDAVHRFLAAYADAVCLSGAELQALPHMIRTIWLCASLDPPLHPRPSLDTDPQALYEALALADWAKTCAPEIRRAAASAQSGKTRR